MLLLFIFSIVLQLCYGSSIMKNYDLSLFANNPYQKPINSGPIPIHFDWRDEKKISPVKNQKNCSAGWAFSVIANIESNLKIHRDIEETLSEQYLIDCNLHESGCHGNGDVGLALLSIVLFMEGVIREREYPYHNKQSECSIPNPKPHYINIPGFRSIQGDEEDMVKALYKYGPLSAGINSKSMSSGKYVPKTIDQPSEEDCPAEDLDHAVLIVGYNVYVDKDIEIPYWIIKNSWGKDWGDEGYYFLERGRNACGIADQVAHAIVS